MRRLLGLCVLMFVVLVMSGGHGKLWNSFHIDDFVKYVNQHGTVIVLVPLLVAWILSFAFGRYRARYGGRDSQNEGEGRVSRALVSRFAAPDYHLLNHMTLRVKDGTTQIDHILVSRFGIFVIETKDYSGWIFANADDRSWTQVLYRVKFRFQNPIRQNYKHVCAVREVLDFVPANDIRSVVVFCGDAEFKTKIPDGVFSLPGLLDYLARQSSEVMSVNRMQFCVGRLETTRLSISKATDIEHVQKLRQKYGGD